MRSERLKGYAKGAVIGGAMLGANIIGVETTHADSPIKEVTSELDTYDQTFLSLVIASATTGVYFFGQRMSDGARKIERQAWKYAVPGTALAAGGMLLARVWQVI